MQQLCGDAALRQGCMGSRPGTWRCVCCGCVVSVHAAGWVCALRLWHASRISYRAVLGRLRSVCMHRHDCKSRLQSSGPDFLCTCTDSRKPPDSTGKCGGVAAWAPPKHIGLAGKIQLCSSGKMLCQNRLPFLSVQLQYQPTRVGGNCIRDVGQHLKFQKLYSSGDMLLGTACPPNPYRRNISRANWEGVVPAPEDSDMDRHSCMGSTEAEMTCQRFVSFSRACCQDVCQNSLVLVA